MDNLVVDECDEYLMKCDKCGHLFDIEQTNVVTDGKILCHECLTFYKDVV